MSQMILFLVIQLLFVGLYAQRDIKFFRKDYTYIEETDSFYKVHTIPKNWQYAKAECELEGATFFYPENETEVKVVTDFLKKTQLFDWVAVGISSLVVKGVFETIDSLPITNGYNKWDISQPDNYENNEDCVSMNRDGFLNDFPCDTTYPFICKKKRNMLQWNQFCNIPNIDYSYNSSLHKCYKFHLKPRIWPDAYFVCHAEQSYLAVIDSSAELNHLKQLINETSKDYTREAYLKGSVLLGFHNRNGDGWKTIKGSPLENSGYSQWGHQQPDGGDKERCGSMSYSGELNDINCSTKAFFICEHDVDIQVTKV